MRFGYTILYVSDAAASVEFYRRAFGLEARFVHDSGQYAELETGQTALSFASYELAGQNVPGLAPAPDAERPPVFEVCLVTDDVPGAWNRAVEAGAEAVAQPETKPWGQQTSYVRDPDGNLIEIASPAT